MIIPIELFAQQIKQARQQQGLSQRELSAQSGIVQSQISKFEQAQVNLTLGSFIALSRVLNLELTLIPRKYLTAVHALINDIPPDRPAYQLGDEDE